MTNKEINGGWHLDKRISWGHIATTVGMLISLIVFFSTMDKRVDSNTKDILTIRQIGDRHEAQAREQMHKLELRMDSQTERLEGRMEAQYNEIIRRLEILDQRMIENSRDDGKNHTR